MRTALHHHRAADDAAVAGEQTLPDRIAENDHFIATGLVVGRLDAAAEQRRRAERRKERPGYAGAEHAFWQLEAGDIERPPGHQPDRLERDSCRFQSW